VVTWGGVIVMTVGVLGLGTTLSGLARETVRQLGQQFAGKAIAEKAARQAAPFLIAMLVEALMSLLPKSDDPARQMTLKFFRGFFRGFGGGAVQHYLTSLDERLKSAARLVPEVAANVVTKGGYRAYLIYRKVSAAVTKITALVKALRLVLTDKRARALEEAFSRFGEYVGTAFLIILFVAVYINFVVASEREQNKIDAWVDRQRKTIQFMVKTTGDKISSYIDDLRADIAKLKASGDEVTPEVLKKHDETLKQLVAETITTGARDVAAIADFLVLLLHEMGIENWDELKSHSFTDLMARGFDALPKGALLPEVADKLGAALGELIGTIMLERRITPLEVRQQKSHLIYSRAPHDVWKSALGGGYWRAAWRFVLFPFRDISSLPGSLKRSLEATSRYGSSSAATFSKAQGRDSAYRQLFKDLLADEDEISRRIIRLAEDAGLKQRIDGIVVKALANELPPHFGELIKEENPDWPGDAIFFIIYTWLRIGMHHLLAAFSLIDDDKPFDGKFKISELLEVLGIDVALDDKILATVKAVFSHGKGS